MTLRGHSPDPPREPPPRIPARPAKAQRPPGRAARAPSGRRSPQPRRQDGGRPGPAPPSGLHSLPEVAGRSAPGSRPANPPTRATPGRPGRGRHSPRGSPGLPRRSCCSRAAAELSLLRGRCRGLGSTSRSGSRGASGDPGGGERRRRRRRSPALAPAEAAGPRARAGLRPPAPPPRPSAGRPSARPERGALAEGVRPLTGVAEPGSPAGGRLRT